MRRGAGFGNCDNVAVANDPGQRDRGGRAIVFGTDTCQRAVTYQEITVAAELENTPSQAHRAVCTMAGGHSRCRGC